ncbi:MAG: signal peptide peptidase SppA [Nanoarchaeota archaeon]|nr:signal peptide peptidase SppA [Nanoarchaeota archaeon]
MRRHMQKGMEKVRQSKWGTVITVLLGLWLVAFAISYVMSGSAAPVLGDGKIVLIPIYGVITGDGSSSLPFGAETSNSAQIVEYINQAGKDDNIKGVILEINSPGGTVVASKEIADAVKVLKSKKPVVAWIREVGASGGYWIASASNKIVADSMSITGSIGVTSSYLEYTGLMDEYGIGYEQLIAGKYKDVGSPFRELKVEERNILQGKLAMIQAHFVNAVAENRGLDKDYVMGISTGMFYLGQEAYNYGLVDYLGGKDLAINVTKELAGIEDAKIVKFEKKKTIFDAFSKLSASAFYYMGRGIGAELGSQATVSSNLELMA